jgi:acyl-CoA reductase-like NAD-dependent aldehyde dehydrogenase
MNDLATLLELDEEAYFQRNLIDGEWVFPAAPYEFDIRSPATSEVIATVALSSRLDVGRARQAARRALAAWSNPGHRREVLQRFALLFEAHVAQLAALQSRETGLDAVDSAHLVTCAGDVLAAQIATQRIRSRCGVTGHVLAAGAPVLEFVAALSGPLAAGHTAVVKPSLRAPLTAMALARLFVAAQPPQGVLNLVNGLGVDVGAAMVSDGEFDQVNLRGHTAWTRRAVAQRRRLDRPEPWMFNGASTTLVVGRAYNQDVVATAIRSGLRVHSAGGPLGLTRLVVHADVYDDVCALAAQSVEGLQCAPLSSNKHREHALAAIAALSDHLLTDSVLPGDRRHRMGWFLPPVIVAMEGAPTIPAGITGPILQVHRYTTVAQLDRLRGCAAAAAIDAWVTPATWTSQPARTAQGVS